LINSVEDVRLGKVEVKPNETDKEKAKVMLKEMCEKLIANTVIEDFSIEIE
jgi:phosphoribosylformylglycinamidine synthase